MQIKENIDVQDTKLIGIANILASTPQVMVYWSLIAVSLSIGVAIWWLWNYLTLIATIGVWLAIVFAVRAIVKKVYHDYHSVLQTAYTTRMMREASHQAVAKTELAFTKVAAHKQVPYMIEAGIVSGKNVKFGGAEISHIATLQSGQSLEQIEAPVSPLPTQVKYEDIKQFIPEGHVLVGIGPNNTVETKDSTVGACVWIVGLSGTGKTSTTVLRVEERAATGHKFLAIDPHWFKPDSLTNAISGYAERFIQPPARDSKETLTVLNLFLDEFNGRKAGRIPQPWQAITLLVDETNALMDAQSEEEKEIKEKLPIVARVCGQEARNFMMGGIFISQQATMLAWLRKVALMVIVHQLLAESEKKLAVNGDMNVVEAMKTWPIGRTYVYGVGFQDGPRTVQQPYFAKEGKGQWTYIEVEEPADSHEPLPFPVARKQNKKAEHVDLSEAIKYWNEIHKQTDRVPRVKDLEERYDLTNHQARRLINEFILPEAASE